jgi:hypothetical protein
VCLLFGLLFGLESASFGCGEICIERLRNGNWIKVKYPRRRKHRSHKEPILNHIHDENKGLGLLVSLVASGGRCQRGLSSRFSTSRRRLRNDSYAPVTSLQCPRHTSLTAVQGSASCAQTQIGPGRGCLTRSLHRG